MTIKDFIIIHKDKGLLNVDIALILAVGTDMISKYTLKKRLPSIKVAIMAYIYNGSILHPYSEDSIIKIIKENDTDED